ncbi:hypothetical protein OOK39_03110 [Streptomyces sp. NBC_00264]|uniref:DUF6629 family protein n=1 Tax=unclassified Streptomyces TaxID=2593676 RepID=UPI002250FC84|nr:MULTISPECIES: DUF6629 family protein [unclassified Streptomyces]WSG49038.1 hypothetical protein OHA38_04120 [Streptomyces sp. NBC_01732]MCX5098752.1 hypothetical protein [Streptomyces sp. NBC_00439]MCX5158289.1 hypothetical protein [Streptomyces sp. NBC_00305]MCX5216812.1 hypothetical protein [Streptomyces sp. NBC_00264]WSC26024.1 hypothetical protein OG902_04730 [Streptomyces sp. NBC_01768]
MGDATCWSATADLVAGTGIAAIGVACVARARRVRDLPLAALPLLLGAHQIIESVIWRSGGATGPATLAWAVAALPVLPLWVALGVLCAAPPQARRRLLIPVAAAVATAVPLAYSLATRPVTAEIRGHTLGYALDLPRSGLLVTGYLLATVGALLLSGDPVLRSLGAPAAAGAVVCVALWRLEFVSTWCAFAAVCSVILLVRIRPDPVPEP